MIEELMTFSGKMMPDPNLILRPKYLEEKPRKKRPSKPSIIIRKKQNTSNFEEYDELLKLEEATVNLIKEQEALALAEKVLKRNQKEQEYKHREILKEMDKNRTVNLNKFLTRAVGFEQKKNFDLEQKRFKKLEEESKLCKERPALSHKTIEICKSLNKKPIYERVNDIIEKRQRNINDLKNKKNNDKRVKKEYNRCNNSFNHNINNSKTKSKSNDKSMTFSNKYRKGNNSMDNLNIKKHKKKEYIINDKTKNKKMNKKEIEEFLERQKNWKDKWDIKNKTNQLDEKNIRRKKENGEGELFHPQISQGSIEIINAKNEANEYNKKYQRTEYNNYYFFDTDYMNNLNYDKNVYERLYEDNALYELRKNEYINKSMCSFQPFTNKNKYRQVQPKYNDVNIYRQKNINEHKKRTRNGNRNKIKGKRSVEVLKKHANDEFHYKIGNQEKNRNNKENKENKESKDDKDSVSSEGNSKLWINSLLKIKNRKRSFDQDDFVYRLNIRQTTAWNENDVNTVPYRGGSLEIVKFFI